MTTADRISDVWEFGESVQAFGFIIRSTSSLFKVPWQKHAKLHLLGEKKDDATVKFFGIKSTGKKVKGLIHVIIIL